MFKKKSKVGDILDVIILILLIMTMFILPSFAYIISIIGNVLMCVIAYRSNIVKSIGCVITAYAFMVVFGVIGNDFSTMHLFDCAISTFNFLLIGLSIGIMCKLTGEISKILIGGTLSNLVIVSLEIIRYRIAYTGSVMDALVNQPVKEFIIAYEEVVRTSGIDFAEMFGASIEDAVWALQQSVAMVVPALLILSSLAVAFIVYVISKKILKMYKVKLYTKNFDQFGLPASASIALVSSYIITMFSSSKFGAACANILIILTTLYVICGFSVVEYKFKSKTRLAVFRVIVYIVALFILSFVSILIPFFNVTTILMIIGMFDGVYDFRKLRSEEYPKEE